MTAPPHALPEGSDEPIRRHDDFFALFHEAMKPEAAFRIGAEMEKCGVFKETGRPVQYEGDHGITRIFKYLQEEHGWLPEAESEDGPVIALLRGGASVTLEPGSQLELSGAPLETIHQICSELRQHMTELGPISKELGIAWLGLGFQPFARREDLRFVPKQRYGVMREYLPTRGAHALDMMLRTCTVQANYDYASEADAIRKMRVALKLSPLTTAMFANSPWKEGAPHGGLTYRGRVWLDVDPDRSGLLPTLWGKDASFARYIEWALDVPMFLFKRHGHKVLNTGQTFRSFWKDGFEGHQATLGDWQTHVNTLFPEVRLKRTIEIRGADCQGVSLACALPALYTGIFYDAKALDEAEALTEGWRYDDVNATRADAARVGLRASFLGATFKELAANVIAIAEGGLGRRARLRSDGKDERVHLMKLASLVERGMTPADDLLGQVNPAADLQREVLRLTELTS